MRMEYVSFRFFFFFDVMTLIRFVDSFFLHLIFLLVGIIYRLARYTARILINNYTIMNEFSSVYCDTLTFSASFHIISYILNQPILPHLIRLVLFDDHLKVFDLFKMSIELPHELVKSFRFLWK